jgi:hypothetical protein
MSGAEIIGNTGICPGRQRTRICPRIPRWPAQLSKVGPMSNSYTNVSGECVILVQAAFNSKKYSDLFRKSYCN